MTSLKEPAVNVICMVDSDVISASILILKSFFFPALPTCTIPSTCTSPSSLKSILTISTLLLFAKSSTTSIDSPEINSSMLNLSPL